MILDKIQNLRNYAGMNAAFNTAADFIEKCIREDAAAGRYELDGDKVYATVIDYVPEERELWQYETHDDYLDVQCVILGGEYQWYSERGDLEITVPYDQEKDISFYGFNGNGNKLHLAEGDFVVYFPQDGHLPGYPDMAVDRCKRIVVKVKL